MNDINFYNLALRCIILVGILLPIGLILRWLTSALLLERPVNWIREGKTILKEIFRENVIVGILFVIEGVVSNLALIGSFVFLILGILFN